MPDGSNSSVAKLVGAVLALVALMLPPYFLLHAERRAPDNGPRRTVDAYLKAAYAHDFKKAYAYISSQDRSYKSERAYIREKGPFNGFTLDVARKLAEMIDTRVVSEVPDGDTRRTVKFAVRLPDANSLSSLLLDWDEDKLNALPKVAQLRILDQIDKQRRAGELKMIEGEEQFVLVKEGNAWRVFLDWASGLKITYGATVPSNNELEAVPLTQTTVVRPNELFTVAYRVKNRSASAITTRIVHRIQPAELKPYLDIVECALLLPVKMAPGQVTEFSTTYLARGEFPDSDKKLDITYDFQIER